MRASSIKVGNVVDIGADRAPAAVVDLEHDGAMVALRLRQDGKRRSCWVAMPADAQVRRVTGR